MSKRKLKKHNRMQELDIVQRNQNRGAKGTTQAVTDAFPDSVPGSFAVNPVRAPATLPPLDAAPETYPNKVLVGEPPEGWVLRGTNKSPMDLNLGDGKKITVPVGKGDIYVPKELVGTLNEWKEARRDGKPLDHDMSVPVRIVLNKRAKPADFLHIPMQVSRAPSEKNKQRKPILLDYVREKILRAGGTQADLYDVLIEGQLKKFVFDDAATRYMAEWMRDFPQGIAMANEFAIPPFKVMWIEMDARLIYQTVTGRESDATADLKVGFLIHGNTVYGFFNAVEQPEHSAATPFVFRLNQPATLQEELELSRLLGVSRMQIDAWFWGSPGERVQLEYPECYGELRRHHAVIPFNLLSRRLLPNDKPDDWQDGFLSGFYKHSAGDLRNLIAALIFLNRTSDVQTLQHVKPAHGLIARKPKGFTAHSVITININPRERLIKLSDTKTGIHKRLHDVRGHYCRSKAARDAEQNAGHNCYARAHWWEEVVGSHHVDQVTGAVLTWKCPNCLGKLWFKPEHKRGKLAKGQVITEYRVTAGPTERTEHGGAEKGRATKGEIEQTEGAVD